MWLISSYARRCTKTALLFCLSFSLYSNILPNESVSDSSEISIKRFQSIRQIPFTLLSDAGYLLAAPSRWQKSDVAAWGTAIALNAVFMFKTDEALANRLSRPDLPTYLRPTDNLADIGDFYDRFGEKNMLLAVTGGFLITGYLTSDKKTLQTSALLGESILFTAIGTLVMKNIIGRARPYVGSGARRFKPFELKGSSGYRSLPSGHASTAFAMATVIAKQYPKWWVKLGVYSVAGGVAMQRLDDQKHWMSDVSVGALMGYWISSTLVRKKSSPANVSLNPVFSTSRLGLSIRF